MGTGVIVLGGHVQGLGIIRLFGKKGIQAVLIDNTAKNISKHSKFCKGFYQVNDDQLFNFIIKLGEEGRFNNWTIFPTNDFQVKILSQNKNELNKYFKVAADDWETVEVFYNKRKTYKLAIDLNIPIAKTFFPDDYSGIYNNGIDFPCIIKPAVMHKFYKRFKKKVFVCNNQKELDNNYKRALEVIPSDEIIIQSIIRGPSKNQFSACFLFIKGQTCVSLVANRMRQHPLDFGNATTYAETAEIPELKIAGEKLLREINYNGLCEVEFKYDDSDSVYKFLEVNPRTWKWHGIANKANTPFLEQYYNFLNGKKTEAVAGFSKASFRHSLTDIPTQLKLFLKGFNYWNRILKPVENAVWDLHDVKPWIFEKIYLVSLIRKR